MLAACAPSDSAPTTTASTTGLTPLPDVEAQVSTTETPTTAASETEAPVTTTTTLPPGLVPASVVGHPWGTVTGLTMFRGNPTRTFYGTGPLPDGLDVLWRFPDTAMCGNSPVGGEPVVWCGTGWTGQPVVWERPDGVTEVIFGAYDKNVHFVNAETGERTRPDFYMGDIIKGSVVLDPDGYPLLYVGIARSALPDHRARP